MTNAVKRLTLRLGLTQDHIAALLITSIYAVIGSAWILLSDRELGFIASDTETLTRLQTWKGWFYVVVTSLLLYFLISSSLRRLRSSREELHRNKRELDLIVRNLPGVVYRARTDAVWTLVYISDAAERITGYSSKEILENQMSLLPIVHKDDRARVEKEIRESIRTSTPFHHAYRIQRRDGTTAWVLDNGNSIPVGENGLQYVEGVLNDITPEVESYQMLQASEERFRSIVQHSNDGIFVAVEYQFRMVNPSLAKTLGYSVEELTSPEFDTTTIMYPDDMSRVDEVARQFDQGGSAPERFEIGLRHRDGHRVDLIFSMSEVEWEGERAILGIARDVTREKRIEAALMESQRLESVGRLAGGIAHDFNNLLTSIAGNAELAEYNIEMNRSVSEELREIRKITAIASGVTRQLLTFSRQQKPTARLIDLNNLISETSELIKRLVGPNIKLVTELPPLTGQVLTDEAQLEQVIINLFVNARDAIGERGGTITLRTGEIEVTDQHNAELPPNLTAGRFITLEVQDDGPGMTAAIRDRIFEPFFTTKEKGKGSGFGLAIVYGIVTQSQGVVQVESEPGMGATFRVFLPWQKAEAREQVDESKPVVLSRTDRHVLLVEDDSAVRNMMIRALRAYGLLVEAASEGEAALYAIEQMPQAPDLVISDVMMPGMSGVELCEILLERYPGLHVLLVSGSTRDVAGDELLGNPRVGFVEKPIGPKQLAQRVEEILSSPRIGRE